MGSVVAGAIVGFGVSAAATSLLPTIGVLGASILGGMAGGATTAAINHGNILRGALFGGLSSGLLKWGFGSRLDAFASEHTLFNLSSNAMQSGLMGSLGSTIGSSASAMFGMRNPHYGNIDNPNERENARRLEAERQRYRAEADAMLGNYEAKIKEYEKAQEDLKHVLSIEEEKRMKREELEEELHERNKRSSGVASERRDKERQVRLWDAILAQGEEALA